MLKKIRQAKPRVWLGAIQIQLVYSQSYYMAYINSAFMGTMFWYTTAGPSIRPYAPWIQFWMFVLLMIMVVISVMVLDSCKTMMILKESGCLLKI